MKRFAVIGNPIAHSLSPFIHQEFAKEAGITLSYEKILSEAGQFETDVRVFFEAGGLGLNITAPFKAQAFAMADIHAPAAQKAKTANVLSYKSGKLLADNTDGLGLLRSLQAYQTIEGARILILGAGGAARGIIGPLLAADPSALCVWNRTPVKAYAMQEDFPEMQVLEGRGDHAAFDVLINATSAGLNLHGLEIPASFWQGSPFCYDLSYSQEQATPFVSLALEKGLKACDGLGMLIEQAALAFEIWHGVQVDTQSCRAKARPTVSL